MEEYTGRERSPPPDPAGSVAAEIPVPNSPTPTGRTFQDNFNSPQMPASPTGGQGLTQEALIEVLRNQHQNIVQQQNLIAGQGAQISELTKLVSGLVQMQTDVLKDQAQREADERERKAEEERKAAEEAATSSTPRAGSLFTSAPKKSDSKYSGSSGGKMESYIPSCPQLEIKDSGRRHEINTWLSFRERFGSWLCLLDECYAAELQEAVKQTTTIEQGKLAPEAAVRSSKLYHWMKQAMSGYKRGLDLAVLQEREQGGLTCGYELFRRINNLLGVTTRAEALSLREAVMRLDVNGLKQLGCPSAGSIKNPLDTCLFLTQEFARLRDQCAAFADLQMMEVDQIMVMMRCLPQEIHRHLAFHGKSSTLRELMESLEFYEQQSKALDFSRDSHKGNPVGYDRPPKGSPKGGKDRTPKGEGKGKEIRCRRCGKPGHVEKDCWSKSPNRTDKDKGKGKGNEKGGKPKGGKDRSHSPYDSKKKGNPKGGKPKGGKWEPKGGKGPKGGKPKGARASVGEEDEEDILGMGCVLDMTVPPDVLLNQLHSYGNRLTTSSVADADATDPHFLVDSGASIHLISQSLVDEGYLQICREWAVNERCTTANGQEMILNRCVEAEFSTHALKSRHVSFLDCDGAAASSPCAASPVAASSRAAAPSPAAPASSSLSPVSRSICAGSQLQRPQKLRVTGLIGYGQVSLLSVALLASKGWTFSCSPGKSCSRTSREVDKPAKPPCLSLSHFGGHDQVPNRTKSSRTHLDIFLWCNVPWISIVHPGVIDIDMSSSLHSLHYTSDVEPSSHRVVRYSTMHEAVQDSVLHVAEREGSSSVHERIDCADPVQPRFRRVEHAFGCLGRYHGVERREEERTESGHGHGRTDRASARHCDRSSRATGCGRGAIGTEGRDAESCPCHGGTRGEYRSDRETSRTGTREEHRSYREAFRASRGKGIGDGEARVRRSKGSSRARDPREAFCRGRESSGSNIRAGSEVSDESLVKLASSTRSEGRGEADQKSRQTASVETAAPVGSRGRSSASGSEGTIVATVVDCDGGRPTTEGVSPEGVEASHQSPAARADCKATIDRERGSGLQSHSQGRVHDPKQASRLDRSQGTSAGEVVGISGAGASVQVFGQEGRREVGRDVGRHDIQSVQVPPKRGVEPPIRARAHLSNPAFDAVRKKEVICTVESEPEFEFEYPIKLRGNRLAKHILQSHTPYDPSCAVCLMSKGLKRAPKRTNQVTNEIQMDIANLCTHPKSPNMYRYVVMWNRTHGMIATAAIYVDQASTIRVLTAAINHCSSTGAMVLSDEGRDLTALISELIRLKVVSRHETSRPGRHATGAERAVRTLKTQLGCIRTVLYQHGLMLGSESLRYAAANACHVHNAFQLQTNSSLTPYQRMRISVTSSGEVPNTNRVMPFGCLVFARPTDGYLEKVREANARHFVPGIYLTPKLSSLGHFVAFEGSQDETVVVPVRDLKIASPIRFVAGLGMLCEIPNSKSGVKPDRIERLPNDLSKPQKLVDLPIHEGEPPWYWSEVNKTSRCPACSNGSETGHSVKCRNRYKKYLEEEYKRIVPIEDESSVPVVPEGLEEGLDTEGKPESQQESGERVPESESEREKRKRKSIDDEWDRFHREHEEKETGERFPEFDDVPFHAPKGQEADTEPTPMQEDPTNPYEIGKNPEPIEDDRMSEGYEPTEVPEGYRAPESPGESPMDIDLFQKIPRRGKNRNHDHWEVDLDKLVLRRVHHRSRKCVFAASSLPLPMPEDQLVGIQRTYYVDAVDERPVDEIPRDQFKVHVSEFGTQTVPLRRHWKGFTELPIKQLYMYDHQGNAIASLSDLGKELWEKVKDPLSRCSGDEVERFLSSVQEGVLEYSRKVPKETEESKFDAKADSCKVWFGGRWIVLRKPSRATSDIGEGPLDVDATFEGMHTEVIALEKHRTGQVVNKNEAQEYCQMHGIRIISTRWVVVNKHDAIKGDIVRSRLVVRDFATGPSAAELGVSSPTASSEALKVVLSYLAQKSSFRKKSKKGGVGKTAWVLDVSTAFLHAPVIHPAVVSLPTGMEDEDGEPLFVILEKAMNGLRSAGMSWYRHLADLLDQEGLTACVTEKTIFAGRYRKGVAETEEENHLIVLMYVDDLLVVGDDRNIQKLVDELSKKLRLKVTGKLEEDRIRFLGKVIEKEEDGTIALYMEKEYYEGMMNLYPGGKESQATPNLFQLYDRDREEDRKPLSPEAAATFRTALGKLGWVAQSRPDLCWLCSMLARGQSQPLAVHETAMRASIRYIRSVADRKLKFRSYEYSGPPRITTYVDASWAAEKSTNRKSTSGAAIFVSDCCVKAFSRLQQSVACSSAEAELYALFEGAKETIGIQHAVAHVYGCQAEELPIPGLLTDSMAARNVTEMSGLLRRLRHIDIRICFLQDAVYKGVISISFVRGTENCADLMTKALSRAVTLQHMETIGVVRAFLISFEVPYDWIGRWLWVMDKVTCTEILIVEFCTSPESEMKEVGSRTEGVEVLTVTEADDGTRSDTIESIREQMISHRKRGKLVVLWSSIPCTGGCPFQYICIKKFGQDYMGHLRELYQIQKKLWKGFLRMSEVADFVAIEWPKRCAYWGWNQTKDFLRKRKTFSTFVDACSVKLNQKGQLIRKTWRIETDSTRLLESLKVCVCDGRHDHLPSKEVNWKETQHYPRRFCELVLKGFKAELES